jgi:hypothetical protein
VKDQSHLFRCLALLIVSNQARLNEFEQIRREWSKLSGREREEITDKLLAGDEFSFQFEEDDTQKPSEDHFLRCTSLLIISDPDRLRSFGEIKREWQDSSDRERDTIFDELLYGEDASERDGEREPQTRPYRSYARNNEEDPSRNRNGNPEPHLYKAGRGFVEREERQ